MTAIATPTTRPAPTALRVFGANVRAEWTKLRSVRSTVWTLLATVGLAVGFGALIDASQMSSWDNLDPAERLRFDRTSFSLSGLFLAQLAVGVLGVLVITSEYATGQIRATLDATPQRLLDRAGDLRLEGPRRVDLGPGCPPGPCSAAPSTSPASDSSALASAPSCAALQAPTPPSSPSSSSSRSSPASCPPGDDRQVLPRSGRHGHLQRRPDPRALSPWAGLAVLLTYGAAALALGGLLLARRDA